jgi:predicted regulator of Ras-like GTPase activity (Roadblock/LC7/MglB family)
MFGFLRKTLRKMANTLPEEQAAPAVETVVTAMPDATAIPRSNGHFRSGNGQHANGKGVELPLQLVLKGLPLELQPRVRQVDVGDATISVPLEMILSQLPRGAVKITFGELRQAASELFEGGADRDRVLVPLPLAEILAQLNPALIARRRVQKKIEVPQEIGSPFDSRGEGLALSVGPARARSGPTPVAREVAPAAPLPPARSRLSAAPPLRPPQATPPPAPNLTPPSAPALTPPSAPALMPPSRPAPIRVPLPTRVQAAKPAPELPSANPAAEDAPMLVGLTTLAESWPEAVRQEIVQLNLVDANVALPFEALERGLKQGRITFTWKMLRSWIKPSPLPTVSAHDGTVLELPLKSVAPLFLARQNESAKSKPKVSIDEKIPNLFFGFPQPEPAAAPKAPVAGPGVAKLPDTNYYGWDDSSDTVRVHESEVKRAPTPTPGTSFVTRYATPNEVVSRAAALDGVAGALITLPDGLMVASRLAPDLNGDTLAAFVPQIFGKLSQATKELRMGELNNLNFTVGNLPWKIFRVNAIFFVAFGRPGEPMPTAQLAALAAELDHKSK